MEFSPFNTVVKHCLQGMELEASGQPEEALQQFLQGWNEATADFEKFIAAHYIARHQTTDADRLQWLETALQFALNIDDDTVHSALPALYANIAQCYEALGDHVKAKANAELAGQWKKQNPSDKGPFYHGTRADMQTGDLLNPGGSSNYQAELTMNHIYFTGLVNGAGLAAALAKGDGQERVYIVEPTGNFENDPNLTDKKFPGNPARSYRSSFSLKVVGEVTDWVRQPPETIRQFREKLESSKGEIIN